jgi:hypothetical protein
MGCYLGVVGVGKKNDMLCVKPVVRQELARPFSGDC